MAQLIGACGEEVGWRCLLLPLLRVRFGPLASSIVVGTVWRIWHVQIFAQAPAYAAGFLLAAISMSVMIGLALDGVRSSRVLFAGGFHALINLGMLLFMNEESGEVLPMVLFGAAMPGDGVGVGLENSIADWRGPRSRLREMTGTRTQRR